MMFEFQKRRMEKEKKAEEDVEEIVDLNVIKIWFSDLKEAFDGDDFLSLDYDKQLFEELKKKIGSDAVVVFNNNIISCRNIIVVKAVYDEDWE